MTDTENQVEITEQEEASVYHCEICGHEIENENEIQYMGDKTLCENCYAEETVACNHCHDAIWRADAISDEEFHLCHDCYNRYYLRCDECNNIINENDSYHDDEDDGNYYCYSCYEELKRKKSIHSYHYKPEPIFYGEGLFLGIELEVDVGGEINRNADTLLDIANRNDNHIYIKHDSSIDDGFEIVGHPMSLDYHRNKMCWKEVFEKAVHMGYRSHQTLTCGLHVHCNRSYFGLYELEQEAAIARIVYLFEIFWNELLIFSRRTEAQLDKWASRYGRKDNPEQQMSHVKNSARGRYTAVNLTNTDTIEFRIFRGSLRYQTFIATLEFVDILCNVCKNLTDSETEKLSWCKFVQMIDKEKYTELVDYLKIKNLYVNEPVTESEDL